MENRVASFSLNVFLKWHAPLVSSDVSFERASPKAYFIFFIRQSFCSQSVRPFGRDRVFIESTAGRSLCQVPLQLSTPTIKILYPETLVGCKNTWVWVVNQLTKLIPQYNVSSDYCSNIILICNRFTVCSAYSFVGATSFMNRNNIFDWYQFCDSLIVECLKTLSHMHTWTSHESCLILLC